MHGWNAQKIFSRVLGCTVLTRVEFSFGKKVHLQVICVMIGTAAFVSARKQKIQSASLFDQRKYGMDSVAKRRRRDSNNTEVEMSQMEETVPLTEVAVDVI